MTKPTHGAIDCDVHAAVPSMKVLLPYLDEYWRDHLTLRGTDRLNLSTTSSPPDAPFSCRPDWRRKGVVPGSSLADLQNDALGAFGVRRAILNCLYASQALHSEDMAIALSRAVNDWLRAEWLDKDPRLAASILVPTQSPGLAAAEIERCAADRRFVQVLLPAMAEQPLGRRAHWPIYATAERLGLPIGIHAGSTHRHAPTPSGWPSYFVEDYIGQAPAFQSQLLSLIAEGVFAKFPKLKVVLIEAGFTWLPAFFLRADKTWRGVRNEVPWVNEPPSEIVRRQVRFTIQPADAPPEARHMESILEQIGCDDLLLFSTDYPHWHFEGTDALPPLLPARLHARITVDNPLATYTRLAS